MEKSTEKKDKLKRRRNLEHSNKTLAGQYSVVVAANNVKAKIVVVASVAARDIVIHTCVVLVCLVGSRIHPKNVLTAKKITEMENEQVLLTFTCTK